MIRSILYIEDDIALGRLLQKRLAPKNYNVILATSGTEGLRLVKERTFDIILLDNFLPDIEGLEMLAKVTIMPHCPPVILLTASGDEGLAVAAMEHGAADYVVKDVGLSYIDLLPAVMSAAVTRYRLVQENAQQQKELQEAWEEAQAANEAKTNFLSMVSHEIRTPLNVIIGIAQLLESGDVKPDDQPRLVSTLRINAQQLLAIINDTLDLTKIEAGAMAMENEQFSVNALMEDIALMFEQAMKRKGINFIIDEQIKHNDWCGDVLRIKQVLINLVSNALKFTQEGHVAIRVREDESALVWIVEDTGIGIPADKIHSIFESFVQVDSGHAREYAGTGLGLAIANQLVKMMKGSITVHSVPEKGTRFELRIPLARDYADDNDVKNQLKSTAKFVTPQAANSTGNRHILLVEDYDANALVAEMMLGNMGYTVTRASSGPEAIEAVEKAQEPFFAILMDIQMHDMDGYETTGHIRHLEKKKNWQQIIMGVTAHALQNEEKKCLEAGMNGYASKPVDWPALQHRLESF